MKALCEIVSLTDYLGNYGASLARKAIRSLRPLHTPGKDPLPDFSDYPEQRTPLEAQQHVAAAFTKELDKHGAGFLIGEPGCIAGESEIYDPVAKVYRRVDQITEPFHVRAYCDATDKFVDDAVARVPFIRGTKQLYSIYMSNGAVFKATEDHEVLTRNHGYVYVRDLRSVKGTNPTLLAADQEGDVYTPAVTVVAIERDRKDVYYDLQVPNYNNYVMAGVVHHNCGKTITSIVTVHEHAKRSRRKGGRGGKYRVIVLCPDTLINKWVHEIETTVLDANVITLDKWSDILKHTGDPGAKGPKRWNRNWDAEWLVVGRDQIKRAAEFSGLGNRRRCFDGKIRENVPHKLVEVDRKDVQDEHGYTKYDSRGGIVTKGVYEKRLICPKCGKIPTEKGTPLGAAALDKKKTVCTGLILREVGKKGGYGNDVLYESLNYRKYKGFSDDTFPSHARRVKVGARISHAGKTWEVQECGEPLFQFHRKPNRWPAACIIQNKMRRWANYLIVDEAHQQKGEGSAQAVAMGKVLSTSKYCMALTGTFIGGYADHLFPLLIRMAGRDMKDRGFEWGKTMPFVERYGCVDRIVRGTVPVASFGVVKGTKSLRKTKLGAVSESKDSRPGIMPTLFSHLVMHRAIFLKLDQFIDNLPGFTEKILPIEQDPVVQLEYTRIAGILEAECSKMISSGNMKLLGTMLWTLLSYPDCPFGWESMFPGEQAVGWWRKPKVYTPENFVGVCTPTNFDPDIILPKEQAFVDLCINHANKNEQTWIYTLLTKKHSPMERLEQALSKAGLRVGILHDKDAPPREREEYINKVGRNVDVMISHPGLVATGLDLFNYTKGNHNFNNLAFFQTGYDLFTVRQAARRGWRIGQEKDCTVTYAYYRQTMQATAMLLMSRKMLAAMQLEEGAVSEEGLAAMGGGGSDQVALINAISNVIDPADIERNWGKSRGGTGKNTIIKKVPTEWKSRDVNPQEEDEWNEAYEKEVNPDEFDDDEEEEKIEFEFEPTSPLVTVGEDGDIQIRPEDDEFFAGEDEQAKPAAVAIEVAEDDFDLDEDDLQEMFRNMRESPAEGDELDW